MSAGVETFRQVALALPCTGHEEWLALREPLESGWLTQGPKVVAFEKAFAARHKVPHALAVTSATTGLHLALAALGVGPEDEVVVPAFTWVATANAAVYCGATPIFVDIDPVTFNMDTRDLVRRITPRTKAVIAVHLFGLCADMDAIRAVVPEGVHLVEDAACAAGASYKGQPAGSIGNVGVFSFHPRKSITTGEGGMITTRDSEIAARVEQLRNHGASISDEMRRGPPKPYQMPDYDVLGYNYRMTDIQGALGVVQLGKLDRLIDERDEAVKKYESGLSGVPWLRLPARPSDSRHAWQAYVTYVDADRAPISRNRIMEGLERRGIATRPGTHAVHMLGYYRDRFGIAPEDYPGARNADQNSMALPLHNRMVPEDFEHVIAVLNEF
jgi:perosamine synthetase